MHSFAWQFCCHGYDQQLAGCMALVHNACYQGHHSMQESYFFAALVVFFTQWLQASDCLLRCDS